MPVHEIIDQFPSVQHAFAYGSGVFTQPGLYADDRKKHEGPMIDLIFAVDDPLAWHKEVTGPSGGEPTAAMLKLF
jgi:translocator assembly and maintenance protein 41